MTYGVNELWLEVCVHLRSVEMIGWILVVIVAGWQRASWWGETGVGRLQTLIVLVHGNPLIGLRRGGGGCRVGATTSRGLTDRDRVTSVGGQAWAVEDGVQGHWNYIELEREWAVERERGRYSDRYQVSSRFLSSLIFGTNINHWYSNEIVGQNSKYQPLERDETNIKVNI